MINKINRFDGKIFGFMI